MDTQLERRLLACPSLPTLPSVAGELLARCRAADIDVPAVVAAIARDPALTARVLKVANTVAPAAGPTATVQRAAGALGPNALLATALSFSLVRARRRGDAGLDHVAAWRRAQEVACAARALAQAAGADADAAWTAGLLQDVGVLALYEVLRREYAALVAAGGGDHARLVSLERERLGTDHAEVAALLARSWSLPPELVGALARSHSDAPSATPVEACAAAAGRLVGGEGDDAALRALGLTPAAVAGALARAKREAEALHAPGAPADVDADEAVLLLDQAKETLVLLSFRAAQGAHRAVAAVRELEAQRAALEARTHRDPLTGLHNRLWAEHVLRDLVEEARRGDRPLTLALCDVDRFKLVNDGYGHATGDAVLTAVAGALTRGVRATDAVIRWGGDEMLMALPDTDAAGAGIVAERARTRVALLTVEGPAHEAIHVSLSIGHATLTPGSPHRTLAELLGAADAALYEAKRLGRDRVVAHGAIRPAPGGAAAPPAVASPAVASPAGSRA
ncbi:MAG: diguanylate cyclase [Anaeromyxobacteraceae bacterium]